MSISFYQTSIPEIKFIHIQNQCFSYPLHTHSSSYTLVMVQKGEVELNNTRYFSNHFFTINPHEAHKISAKNPSSLLTCSVESAFFTKYDLNDQASILNHLLHHPAFEKHFTFSFSFIAQLKSFFEPKKLENKNYPIIPRKITGSFLRKFKRTWGITPHQFKIQNKVRLAQNLLLQPTESLTHITYDNDFYDQSHFIHTFKKWLNLTPKKYQQAQYYVNINTEQEKT